MYADMNGESAQPTANSRGKRLLIGLTWGLIQLVILCALFFAGGVAAGYLAIDVFSGRGTNTMVPAGFAVGVIAALVVNHSARIWLQRLRLRGLRVHGVAVEAEVVDLDREYTASTRGPGSTKYSALVRWTDPATGVSCQGEHRYRFSGQGSRRLETACAHGAKVPVYYPPGRPSRFIIDIPFAPSMADFFL
jgi:hypothetical protein